MRKKIKPGMLLISGYAILNFLGTILLWLPISASGEGKTSLLDAWFTATSALTVTGLTVVSTVEHWSHFGQAVILLLMQVGGLGIMVIATLAFTALGLKIQLGHRMLIAQDRNYFSISGVIRLVKNVVLLTLALELMGALLMGYFMPAEIWQQGWQKGLFFSVFHAVSAFNGAGFDLTGQSLEPFNSNIGLNLVVMTLILLGSLGYVVLQELFLVRRWQRLSLHTRMVLWVTGGITVFGSLFYYLSEYSRTLAGLGYGEKFTVSLFQAVTRTAGFTTVPIASWQEPFIFLMILMMFIGASPGSVGGGIKTTTFGTVILAVLAIVRGKKEVVVFERELAPDSVAKAFTVVVMVALLAACATLALMVIEGLPFMTVLFEVISAMATVGLSLGITGELSPAGQVIIGLLMFIGRIGVLSLVMVLAGEDRRRMRYMKEDILIG